MSKKHFIAIAADFKEQLDFYRTQRDRYTSNGNHAEASHADDAIEATSDLAWKLARTFAGFNPNFDRLRFLAACGIVTVA